MVSAATSALTMASSVASTVASKNGERSPFGSHAMAVVPVSAAAPGLAVEKARKMSPDPLAAVPPRRAMPIGTRRARRSSWWGRSGAVVATTTMIEPSRSAGGAGARCRSAPITSRPTGTPATVRLSREP